eukprot:613435-Rhodomonas_salina.2
MALHEADITIRCVSTRHRTAHLYHHTLGQYRTSHSMRALRPIAAYGMSVPDTTSADKPIRHISTGHRLARYPAQYRTSHVPNIA